MGVRPPLAAPVKYWTYILAHRHARRLPVGDFTYVGGDAASSQGGRRRSNVTYKDARRGGHKTYIIAWVS